LDLDDTLIFTEKPIQKDELDESTKLSK